MHTVFLLSGQGLNRKKDHFDEAEVEHYRKVIACCREYHVEPIVTLHHFTSPKWLICDGGWDDEMVVERFAIYAKYIAEKLGARTSLYLYDQRSKYASADSSDFRAVYEDDAGESSEKYESQQDTAKEEKLEGQVQVGINLSDPMERMKLGAMENAKIFGTPQPRYYIRLKRIESRRYDCL